MLFPGLNTQLPDINGELASIEGYLSEEKAKEVLAKYIMANPAVSVELMTGIKLYPFQEMILRAMFQKDFFLLICGRGLSKSFLGATFCWLYALYNPNIRIGILSSSFRQSRIIFNYIEKQFEGTDGALLGQCVPNKPSHLNDIWKLQVGSSEIVALPLGSSGAKLRGFRFNCILVDELLLMPPNTITEVIFPFLSVLTDPTKRDEIINKEDRLIARGLMTEADRTKFINPKFIGLSSASYKFEFLYKLYEEYCRTIYKMEPKSKSYGVIKLAYDIAPPNLLAYDYIEKQKDTMSEAQFNREYGSMFTDDSGGYFSKRKMDTCTIMPGNEPTIEIAGDPKAKYIVAIDPSFSAAETSDHYAMGLFKLNEEKRKATLVHNYAVAGGKLQDHMTYFSYLLRYFNIVYVIIDQAGHWFVDECNASVIFAKHNLRLEFFDADFENVDYMEGLKNAKDSYKPGTKAICHSQRFSPEWIRLANEYLSASFDHQLIWFAARALDKLEALKKIDIPLDELVYDNRGEQLEGVAKKSDFIEYQGDLIDMVKKETALIEIRPSPTGATQSFQLPQSVRRDDSANKTRKDNYTTLLLGNWACKCYYDMIYTNIQEPLSFTPFFIK